MAGPQPHSCSGLYLILLYMAHWNGHVIYDHPATDSLIQHSTDEDVGITLKYFILLLTISAVSANTWNSTFVIYMYEFEIKISKLQVIHTQRSVFLK